MARDCLENISFKWNTNNGTKVPSEVLKIILSEKAGPKPIFFKLKVKHAIPSEKNKPAMMRILTALLLKELNACGLVNRIIAGIILAITLPNLLQTKLELDRVNICNVNQNNDIKTDNDYIYLKKGDNVKIQPVINNISDTDLKDLEISISTENSLANIITPNIENISISAKSKLNGNDFICDNIKEDSKMLELEISSEAKSGSKIPVNITVKNKLTGKRADFLQKIRVE